MATGTYSLYLADGVTPVAITKPNYASWEEIERDPYPDGRDRVSIYKRVVWKFPRLTAAEYQKFKQYKLSSRQVFETWKQPEGAVAGAFVVCTGVMKNIVPGIRNQHNEYNGVTVTWVMVTQS